MVTQKANRVINESALPDGVPAADAHEIAGISYRQLDHWARQGWVRPSLDEGQGRAGRRRYSRSDVVRLDLLRHLAQSGVNLTMFGPVVATLEMPEGDERIVWGPLGVRDQESVFRVVSAEATQTLVEKPGSWVVYSADSVNARFDKVTGVGVALSAAPTAAKRRSA